MAVLVSRPGAVAGSAAEPAAREDIFTGDKGGELQEDRKEC